MDTKPMQQNSRVYEDFEPTCDWLHDVDHDTLLVYLPGFRKDQLKVQATSAQKLRIVGERPIGDNKWSRFTIQFPISSIYDFNKITAKFEKGTLHVKHPKIIIPTAPKITPHGPVAANGGTSKSAEKDQPKNSESEKNTNDNSAEEGEGTNTNGGTSKSAEKDQPKNSESTKNANDNLAEKECLGNAGGNKNNMEGINSENGKSKRGSYRRVLAKLKAEMKQPRQTASLVMASLIVVGIGIYAKSSFRFHGGTEN